MAKKQLLASYKQLEVFMYIIRFVEANGYQPSQQQMATALGVSKRAILDRLHLLVEKGYLTLSGQAHERSIRLHNVGFEAKYVKKEEDGLPERKVD